MQPRIYNEIADPLSAIATGFLTVNGDLTTNNLNLNGSLTPVEAWIEFSAVTVLHSVNLLITGNKWEMLGFGSIKAGLTNGVFLSIQSAGGELGVEAQRHLDFLVVAGDSVETGETLSGDGYFSAAWHTLHTLGHPVHLDPGDRVHVLIEDDLRDLDGFHILAQGHYPRL
jgi:hypothetical protein